MPHTGAALHLEAAPSFAASGVRCLLPVGSAAPVRRLCEAAHATGADVDGI